MHHSGDVLGKTALSQVWPLWPVESLVSSQVIGKRTDVAEMGVHCRSSGLADSIGNFFTVRERHRDNRVSGQRRGSLQLLRQF
jgi:hypothetical protein